jgi:hypothetical protein
MKALSIVFLVLLLIGSAILNLNLSMRLAEARDRRPAGDTFALKQDMPVYLQDTSKVAFSLPRGTLLQESSPIGMATLGKFVDQEFLLTLKVNGAEGWQVDRNAFEPHSTSDGHYAVNYLLWPSILKSIAK